MAAERPHILRRAEQVFDATFDALHAYDEAIKNATEELPSCSVEQSFTLFDQLRKDQKRMGNDDMFRGDTQLNVDMLEVQHFGYRVLGNIRGTYSFAERERARRFLKRKLQRQGTLDELKKEIEFHLATNARSIGNLFGLIG